MAELEGFLCPLCRQDCRSVRELEAHYREEHQESAASKFKKEFVSFFENAFNISPKQSRAKGTSGPDLLRSISSPEADDYVPEPVSNVSGINPEYWDPQEMGRVVVHSVQFRRIRDAHLAGIIVDTNRMVIRLEKLFRMLKDTTPRTARQMKSVEQNVVHWKKDKDEKSCGGCGNNFGVVRRRHHCRLCGDIRCKDCCNFMTLQDTYPLLQDCPDYDSLKPCEPLLKKKFQFKRLRGQPEEEEDSDEVRMCFACKKLVNRRLFHLGALETPPMANLYEKMKQFMDESEQLKPEFLEVAKVVWSGEPGHTLQDASLKRQELLKIYESVDAASKRILSIGASDPSPRGQKLARNVRVFASNYLQEHLLRLPALPTPKQLADLKAQKEREAEEKIRELQRQREQQCEQQRQLQILREAKATPNKAAASVEEDDSGNQKMSSADIDKISADTISGKAFSDAKFFSMNTLRDISKGFQSILPNKEGEEEERRGGTVQEGGWMCNTQVRRSFDERDEKDPFVVQREQLLSYIAQAKSAKRFDEVRALEQSLRDIETVMQEQKMSYGFTRQET